MQSGDHMIPVFDHRPATRILYAKETLEEKFPVLAKVAPMARSFRQSKVAEGKRIKGTYCLQCLWKRLQTLNSSILIYQIR